jgi:RNA polymerase sigma factor (sigma-70 family)
MPGRLPSEALVRAAVQPPADGPDADLLSRFAAARDPEAFAELVQRHGPMVLGVCRRTLGNTPDAEDAFQVVWLVLVRKAHRLPSGTALGHWLHGVAVRTAAHTRGRTARSRVNQRELPNGPDVPDPHPNADPGARELAGVLDAELAQLPEKYRAAVVLCALEGRALADAAAQLGVPPGTVASRLARGRALLGERLRARGFAGAVGVVLGGALPALSARFHEMAVALLRVGPQELSTTVSELTHEVLKTMLVQKLKVIGRGVAALVLFTAAVSWAALTGTSAEPKLVPQPLQPPQPPPAAPGPQKKEAPAVDPAAVERDLQLLSETFWCAFCTEPMQSGLVPTQSPGEKKPLYLRIKADGDMEIIGPFGPDRRHTKVTIDPARTPKTIDIEVLSGPYKGKKQYGIYEIKPGKEKKFDAFVLVVADLGTKEDGRPKDLKKAEPKTTRYEFGRGYQHTIE